ncbi:MAG: hypothetical protein C0504_19975 [Candidatus Solibacter sp.]|nr:hypothetical protein [Candidatus Solibacter sp.]
MDIGDFFVFRIGEATMDLDGPPYGGARYPVETTMAGRTFAKFHLDVGVGDIIVEPTDMAETRDWLGFAGLDAPRIPMMQSEQQFAEKLHAYSLPREGAANSRVRDHVDLTLLVRSGILDDARVAEAIQELLACRLSISFRRRLDPVPFQDRRDRAPSDLVPKVGQGPLDSPVAPISILPGQSHDQGFELTGSAGPARSSLAAPVVLLGNQLAVPGKQGLRRDDGRHFRKDGTPQPVGLGGQPAALIVIQSGAFAVELFPEDSIFFAQVLDDLQLALAHPAGDRDQEEPEWIQQFRHRVDPIFPESPGRNRTSAPSDRSSFEPHAKQRPLEMGSRRASYARTSGGRHRSTAS